MILQDLGDINSSLIYFHKALEYNEAVNSGSDECSLLTAAMYVSMLQCCTHVFRCHAIATNYSVLDKYKEALEYEKRNYNNLVKSIGSNQDPRVEESNLLLKQYTAKAVEQQMSSREK